MQPRRLKRQTDATDDRCLDDTETMAGDWVLKSNRLRDLRLRGYLMFVNFPSLHVLYSWLRKQVWSFIWTLKELPDAAPRYRWRYVLGLERKCSSEGQR
jgi:hypothetical protein